MCISCMCIFNIYIYWSFVVGLRDLKVMWTHVTCSAWSIGSRAKQRFWNRGSSSITAIFFQHAIRLKGSTIRESTFWYALKTCNPYSQVYKPQTNQWRTDDVWHSMCFERLHSVKPIWIDFNFSGHANRFQPSSSGNFPSTSFGLDKDQQLLDGLGSLFNYWNHIVPCALAQDKKGCDLIPQVVNCWNGALVKQTHLLKNRGQQKVVDLASFVVFSLRLCCRVSSTASPSKSLSFNSVSWSQSLAMPERSHPSTWPCLSTFVAGLLSTACFFVLAMAWAVKTCADDCGYI